MPAEAFFDLIIIGAGPAGITAGVYAVRKKIKTLLITKDFLGQMAKTSRVENWPGIKMISGMELAKKFEEHLKSFNIGSDSSEQGIAVKAGISVVGIKEIKNPPADFCVRTEDNKEYFCKAIIAASGASPKHLGIKGEEKFIGRGVAFCSICDAPFFKNKDVAVVGGGNGGFEAALDLADYAKHIYILERSDKVIADKMLQTAAADKKKIEVKTNIEAREIKGTNMVESIEYENNADGAVGELKVGGVFVEIGTLPNSGYLENIVETDGKGRVKVCPSDFASSNPALFAPGDINNIGRKQIIIAAGQGASAALAADDYLKKYAPKGN